MGRAYAESPEEHAGAPCLAFTSGAGEHQANARRVRRLVSPIRNRLHSLAHKQQLVSVGGGHSVASPIGNTPRSLPRTVTEVCGGNIAGPHTRGPGQGQRIISLSLRHPGPPVTHSARI